jgi:hypothetical protein
LDKNNLEVVYGMRSIDWDIVPDHEVMVLLTVSDLFDDMPLRMADFKDDCALVFKETGHFIGLTLSRGVRLGKDPFMVNGIWFIKEDSRVQDTYADLEINSELVDLKVIQR